MNPWPCLLVLCWAFTSLARADDIEARRKFDEGIRASEMGAWRESLDALEASLAQSPKLATRYNLILVYHELGQPLDVVRHSLVFLREATGQEREAARARVQVLFEAATAQLAVLDVSSVSDSAGLRIDGTAPAVVDGTRVYLLPGRHELSTDGGSQGSQVTLVAGETTAWPSPPVSDGHAEIASPAAIQLSPPGSATHGSPTGSPTAQHDAVPVQDPARQRAAYTLGATGAALAVAAITTLWIAYERGDDLAAAGIPGSTETGFLSDADRYRAMLRAVTPLAVSGGVLLSAAAVLVQRHPSRGRLLALIASLVVGATLIGVGSYYLAHQPEPVIPGSQLEQPSRQLGGVLLSDGVPFVSYGVSALLTRRMDATRLSFRGPLRFTW